MNVKFKKLQDLEESGIHPTHEEHDEEEKGEVSKLLQSIKSSPSKFQQDEALKFSQLNHNKCKG